MDRSSPLYKKMKKALRDERINRARLASELELSDKDIQAYERLLREDSPEKQPELISSAGESLTNAKQMRRNGASEVIAGVIGDLPNKFMIRNLKENLKLRGLQFPVSTINAVVRKMAKTRKIEEVGKEGKEKIFVKKDS